MKEILQGSDNELEVMNRILSQVQNKFSGRFKTPDKPILFIIGLPRSGSTLLTQLLINNLKIGYITNFIARFWQCPVVGAILQEQIFGGKIPYVAFQSSYGQTNGPFGPHEFGFFWRRWFKYGDSHYVKEGVDASTLKAEIASLQHVMQKPLLFKNLAACGLHAEWLSKLLPTSKFILIRRNPQNVARSIMEARVALGGNKHYWFSVKPKDYLKIKNLPPEQQIAHQILEIEIHLAEQLNHIHKDRWCVVDYDQFIQNPTLILDTITSTTGLHDQLQNASVKFEKHGCKMATDPSLEKEVRDIVETNETWQQLYST